MNNHTYKLVMAAIQFFILGGNASFTATSKVTGMNFSYRVRRVVPEDGTIHDAWYSVTVFDGVYTHIGNIYPKFGYAFNKAAVSRSTKDGAQAFSWMWNHFIVKGLPVPKATLTYAGVCSCCNRRLKTKKSLTEGVGPHCKKTIEGRIRANL